jgi:hypothetical protein
MFRIDATLQVWDWERDEKERMWLVYSLHAYVILGL